MKKITVLGSTGSIGTQSLQIIRENPQKFKVVCLAAGKNIGRLESQIREFQPERVSVERESDGLYLQKKFPKLDILWGRDGLVQAAKSPSQMVVNGLMGMVGLEPTLAAIEEGKDIAFANKETLVAGGQIVMEAVKRNGVKFLPVDSEHSAIFQCLEGNQNRKIKKIILTCSGGPFRGYSIKQLREVTRKDALRHPNWSMGSKITIDSATLMNKGLEVIEAKWLFDVDAEDIQVVIHPQSILHSAVEYMDHSVIGQLGTPDMKTPISLALAYPDRLEREAESLDFFTIGATLTFEKPDVETFKPLKLAYDAIEAGGSYPVVMNASNEVLVQLFLEDSIKFVEIQEILEKILDRHKPSYEMTLEEILEIDRRARKDTKELVLEKII